MEQAATVDWRPVVEAAAAVIGFWLWPWMIALTWFVWLVSREVFVRWVEAVGLNGIIGFVVGLRDALRGSGQQVQLVRELRVSDAASLPVPSPDHHR